MLLTLTGGFLDAFTFVGHGRVFANSMTGNVVFLGVYAAAGQWAQALRHIPPILAFFVGLFIAYVMGLPRMRRWLPRPAIVCLAIETVVLAAGALLPASFPDGWLVPGIAIVAAMQNSSFSRLGSWAYNSVMTTGNLQKCASGVFHWGTPPHDPLARRQAGWFGLVSLCFLIGAVVGALGVTRLHNAALWAPVALLAAALAFTRHRDRAASDADRGAGA